MTRLPNTEYHLITRIAHGTRTRTRGVVIHDIEGAAAGAISWFANPQAGGVGAHVVIGTKKATQLCDLDAVCWHAVGANADTIGFEHEGRASDSKWTWIRRRTQRKLSANRTAWVCFKYGLGEPKRGKNVFAHADFPQGGHHDPGPNFPWTLYMLAARRAYRNLVRSKGRKWTRI